ncbi:dynamin family protein [Bacteroides ovatus]|uniref:dynamin family protein n=1 Tax=Bacteroides ovatus TaxID=28116 RepID=UPI000E556E55|nr:dynamin family protein [Bacteroides ovatus]RGR15281.1 hypothetical protein DWY64_20375 [Bacteroides ovatus]
MALLDNKDFNDDEWGDERKENTQKPQGTVTECTRSTFLRLNPYECSPEKALKLMGKICQALPSDNLKMWMTAINNLLFQEFQDDVNSNEAQRLKEHSNLEVYFFANRDLFCDKDFIYRLKEEISQFLLAMDKQAERLSPKAVYVSVAGSFNAAKSTLLNYLARCPNLLPVDNIPATVVPAFLHCGDFCDRLSVSGVNKMNAIVPLDSDVLNSISHSKEGCEGNAAQIAASLQHFIVQVPNQEYRDLVFIDTPGYDNVQDKKSELSSDRIVANKYMQLGEVVLWLIPVTEGSLKVNEIDILKKLGLSEESKNGKNRKDGKPSQATHSRKIILLITKSDLRNEDSRMEIFDLICSQVENIPYIVDVATLSTYDSAKWQECWHSRSGNDFDTILRNATSDIPLLYETQICVDKILRLFNDERNEAEKTFHQLESECNLSMKASNSAVLNLQKARNKHKLFWANHESIQKDVRLIIEEQFKNEVENIEKDHRRESNKIENLSFRMNDIQGHISKLREWEHQLKNWFKDVLPMLDYHETKSSISAVRHETVRLYFKLSQKRKRVTPHVHYWTIGRETIWPGEPMIFTKSEKGNNIWQFDLPDWASGVVFSVVQSDGTVISQSIDFINSDIKKNHVYNQSECIGPLEESVSSKKERNSKLIPNEFDGSDMSLGQSLFSTDIFKAIELNDCTRLFECLSIRRDITGIFNSKGMSAVTYAAHIGSGKSLDLFVRHGGESVLNIADKRGFNALHSAASSLMFETCAAILRANAKLAETRTIDGRSIVDLIPQPLKKHYETIQKQIIK